MHSKYFAIEKSLGIIEVPLLLHFYPFAVALNCFYFAYAAGAYLVEVFIFIIYFLALMTFEMSIIMPPLPVMI